MIRGTHAHSLQAPASQDTVRGGNRWLVLVVDDEPEIHEITRLVLGDVKFSGIPVELHSAYSAFEARSFLEAHPDTAVMLLDVVMETDDAGLRLITSVREQLGNADLQIVVRTGQPGMAPEHDVIGAYDVNGYFLKTELVAQKMRSIVISSLRAYSHLKTLRPEASLPAVLQANRLKGIRRQVLEEDFARALEEDSLHLLAQPQVHLESGSIAAIELMPNWRIRDSVLGRAQLADEICDPDLRLQFDDWLFRRGCAWLSSWQSSDAPAFRVSLPMFTDSIWDGSFPLLVERYLSQGSIPRDALDLTMSQAVVSGDVDRAREILAVLRSSGVSLTLLDFGSGGLSLPQLQGLSFDRVKIHHSFVRNVAKDQGRASIARSIIALAHTLGMTVIADGVVSEDDLQFFKWEGCDIGQGDLLARPMALSDIAGAIRSGLAPSLWLTNQNSH